MKVTLEKTLFLKAVDLPVNEYTILLGRRLTREVNWVDILYSTTPLSAVRRWVEKIHYSF